MGEGLKFPAIEMGKKKTNLDLAEREREREKRIDSHIHTYTMSFTPNDSAKWQELNSVLKGNSNQEYQLKR